MLDTYSIDILEDKHHSKMLSAWCHTTTRYRDHLPRVMLVYKRRLAFGKYLYDFALYTLVVLFSDIRVIMGVSINLEL